MTLRSAKDIVTEARTGVVTITAGEAARSIGTPGTVFVDVREAHELDRTGTIEGALHIPRGVLEFQADPSSPSHDARLDPSKRIVLFCASGGRSTLAAKALTDMGYADVASVEGGFSALAEAGAPTTRG